MKKPLSVIWKVHEYRRIVDEELSPHIMLDEDFVELMTQICHVLLNNHYQRVESMLGPTFPQCYRMRDNCYESPQMAETMIEVTRKLVRYAIFEFQNFGLFEDDGTLSYAVHALYKNHIILEHLPY